MADFSELAPLGRYLKSTLDHRDLDEVFTVPTTTSTLAEHCETWFRSSMAPWLSELLQGVRVWTGRTPSENCLVARRVDFDAAHHLDGLPAGHKCARVHGHSYRVEVLVKVENDQLSRQLAAFDEYIRDVLDYRDLSAVFEFQATSELLAEYLYEWCVSHFPSDVADQLWAVRVWESARRWAQFSREPMR